MGHAAATAHRRAAGDQHPQYIVAHWRGWLKPEKTAASFRPTALPSILKAPLNLFLQALTTFTVLHRVISRATTFFAQRKPYELGSFSWTVDGKEPAKVTRWEEWWAHYAQGALASMSKRRPAWMLPEAFNADYSFYEKFNSIDEKGEAGTSLKLLQGHHLFRPNAAWY